jgi:hypothetical protein
MTVDMFGRKMVIGDILARPKHSGAATARIVLTTVTKIVNDKVYLDNANRPIKYPDICIVVNDLPHLVLPKKLKAY